MSKIAVYENIFSSNIKTDKESILELLPVLLSEKRYHHVLRVYKKAQELAIQFQLSDTDKQKLEYAALLHDIAKGMSSDDLISYSRKLSIEPLNGEFEESDYVPAMYHAVVGAWMIENFFKITDKDILDAVFYHTTGYADLGIVGQLLFLADYLEEGRTIERQHIEAEIPNHINKALLFVVQAKLIKVLKREQHLHCYSLDYYHDLINKIKTS